MGKTCVWLQGKSDRWICFLFGTQTLTRQTLSNPLVHIICKSCLVTAFASRWDEWDRNSSEAIAIVVQETSFSNTRNSWCDLTKSLVTLPALPYLNLPTFNGDPQRIMSRRPAYSNSLRREPSFLHCSVQLLFILLRSVSISQRNVFIGPPLLIWPAGTSPYPTNRF